MDKVYYVITKEMQGALPFIRDHIKKQKAVNDRFTISLLFTALAILATDKMIRLQNARIEELSNEVKELKQMRGE